MSQPEAKRLGLDEANESFKLTIAISGSSN